MYRIDINRKIDHIFIELPCIIFERSFRSLVNLYLIQDSTPLMLAVLCGQGFVVKCLVKAGAQISKTNSRGTSALDLAQSFLKLPHSREIPQMWRLASHRGEAESFHCEFYTSFTQSLVEDQIIFEYLKEAAREQDPDVQVEDIDMQALRRGLVSEFFSNPSHFLKYNPTIVLWRTRLRRKIFQLRSTYEGIDKLTLFEILAFRTAALVVFIICLIFNLYTASSNLRTVRLPTANNSWLLISLIVGVLAVQAFWDLYT